MPAERSERGTDVADDVRRDQRQVFRSVMFQPGALPAIGHAGIGMDRRRQYGLPPGSDQITDPLYRQCSNSARS